VVIPCRDAAAVLAEQLGALAEQTWRGPWEVLVADNGSRDETTAVVREFESRLPLRVVDASARRGQGFARNAGAAASRGETILFCDADDVVAPEYVEAMARCLAAPGAALAAPRFDFERLNPAWIAASRENAQATGLQPYTEPPYLPHAGGSGLGVRREAHRALGGFDEGMAALEDTDYCWRAQGAGLAFRFCPDAVVHVRLRHDLGGVFRQALSYGRHNVRMYARYRDDRALAMPRLSRWRGLAKLGKLAFGLPRLASRSGRARWVSQLGWRLGRLDGCVRYRVWAP
jgi:glycosyltransferase involved in cell wall biosynthesis